jgi:hypothetical protein
VFSAETNLPLACLPAACSRVCRSLRCFCHCATPHLLRTCTSAAMRHLDALAPSGSPCRTRNTTISMVQPTSLNDTSFQGHIRSTPPQFCTVSTSRFQNQIRNRLRLGYQRNVTRVDLDRLGAHPLCHEALEIRVDGPILRRHRVPARLRTPCRVRGFASEQGPTKRPLHREERPCFRIRQVAREVPQKSLLAEASFIAIKYYAG